MRNKTIYITAFALAVLTPFLVFSVVIANHGGDDEEQTESMMEEEKHRTEAEERMEDRLVELRTNSTEDGGRMEMHMARLLGAQRMMQNQINRAEKAMVRLENIITRIETRRDKIEDAGVNATTIDKLITDAKTQKDEAREALDTAKEALADIETSDDPKTDIREFMVSIKALKKEMIDLHKGLKSVIKEMRRLMPKSEDDSDDATSPTPTPAPSSTNN
ncbi:MAG: hypothetical protein KW793_01840 [Candidatus Doudnabacteria bacterium]|nr:hypothetical protein [Candidatus Doudnabacteria bacterium]